MPDPAAYALLIVVAIAYLGGAVLVIAVLAEVLVAWSEGWRPRSMPVAQEINPSRIFMVLALFLLPCGSGS
ncbi:hypothetical protein [Nocardioides astragali]|uniref:Uncharacterized protein n=1 Tax=Nocardioides astragali TaxID=1776736 RepID=A0ABW2MYN6_9ACTN|nr:hypothetical protein [Nocardioides astragali]